MKDIEKLVRVAEFVDTGYQGKAGESERSHRRGYYLAAACAVAALLTAVPFAMNRIRELTDTYDNPEMAYAKLEQSFARISDTMDRGMEITENTYNKMVYENNE